jgi:carboxylesterase
MSVDVLPGCEAYSHRGSDAGVLVLHGFTGNPTTMRALAGRAVAAGYGVEMPRLPGHGTSVEDLATTSWGDWTAEAEAAYDRLAARSERVAVVGLSMGGGLSAHIAEVRPSVAGCVLINPTLTPPPVEIVDGVTALLEAGLESYESIGSDIKKEGVAEASYDATPLRPLASLFEGLVTVRENLRRITAPCLLITSREDHTVNWENGDDLVARAQGAVERVWLENSYHVATLDHDADLVESLTLAFLARVLA